MFAFTRFSRSVRERLFADDAAPRATTLGGRRRVACMVSGLLSQFGWMDFDPTNNMIPAQKHITLACVIIHYVSPIKGVILGGGQHSWSVSVDVQPHSTNGELGS